MRRIITLFVILALVMGLCPAALALSDEDMDAALYEAAQEALALLEEDMTDIEKLTVLHDWLCLRCEYGMTPNRDTAYGAIVEGRAVCLGYASGYAYLATLAGLDGIATYSEEIDHAWILTTLDGERYFSDTTWDDGKKAKLGLIRHNYFIFDEQNAADTGHYGWDSTESVPGGPLEDIPWAGAQTRVIFQGDWCWYIDSDFTLWRCDRRTWETEQLLTMDHIWPVWDDDSRIWTGIYTGLVLTDGRLWFSTPYELCSVAPDGSDLRTELQPDTTEGLIYGLGVQGGFLCYSIATEPDAVIYDVVQTDIPADAAWGYAPAVADSLS